MALTNFLTTDKALASVLNAKVVAPTNEHISNDSNPHNVTKTQLELENVTNDEQIPKSIIDAAGDLIYGTADNTPARLAKGTDGQVLTLASGLPSWVTAAKFLSGSFSDTTTSIPANAEYTKTIPIGFNAECGTAICGGTYPYNGAIISIAKQSGNSIGFGRVGSSSRFYNDSDGYLTDAAFDADGTKIILKECYILNSNLIFVFKNNSGTSGTLKAIVNWEVHA